MIISQPGHRVRMRWQATADLAVTGTRHSRRAGLGASAPFPPPPPRYCRTKLGHGKALEETGEGRDVRVEEGKAAEVEG